METYRLEFKASNGFPSACEITIHRSTSLVIATETGEGMSVTNACEIIASEVVKRHHINPLRLLFIEHYPLAQRPDPLGETYDLVSFRWDAKRMQYFNPEWSRISKQVVMEIIEDSH